MCARPQATVRADQAALASARLFAEPAFSLQAIDIRSNDQTSFSRVDTVQAAVTVPLSDGGLGRAQVREAEAALSGAQAQEETARRTVLVTVSAAYLTAQSTRSQVAAALVARDVAQISYDKTRLGYENGLFPLSDVLNAQAALRQAQIAYTQALYDAAVALGALNAALNGGALSGLGGVVTPGASTPAPPLLGAGGAERRGQRGHESGGRERAGDHARRQQHDRQRPERGQRRGKGRTMKRINFGCCCPSVFSPAAGTKRPQMPTRKTAPLPTVQVATVTTDTLERTLPATGTLMALRDHEATLSPPVAGMLDTLPIRYGQSVQKGQVIAHLSTRQLQGQIEQAQATLGQNQVQVQQAQANALQQQAQTQTAIQQALSAVSSARATLRGTQATLIGDEAALRNAQQAQARAQTLFADGLVAQKDVEAADLAVRTAQAAVDAQRQTVAAQAQTVAGQRQAVAAARAASLQDVVKRKDVQVARQQVRNAQGALATARAQEALYTIRAPLSGQITQVGAAVGETVDTTAKLATIADLRTLQLQIGVPGSSARQVRPGETVTFSVSSLPGETFRTDGQQRVLPGGRGDGNRARPRHCRQPPPPAPRRRDRQRSRSSRSGGPTSWSCPRRRC